MTGEKVFQTTLNLSMINISGERLFQTSVQQPRIQNCGFKRDFSCFDSFYHADPGNNSTDAKPDKVESF